MRALHRPISSVVLALGLALTLSVAFAPGARASAADRADVHRSRDSGVRIAPVPVVDGMTRAQVLAQANRFFYTTPVTTDFDPCIRLGRTGSVVYATDQDTPCTIEQGDSLVGFFGSSCDDVVDPAVDPTFYGADAAAQRRCAVAYDRAHIADQRIWVDGGEPVDIRNRCFEVVTAQQHVQMPADNFYGVSPRPVTFVAHAWVAITQGLRPGTHIITFEATPTGQPSQEFDFTVHVLPRHHG